MIGAPHAAMRDAVDDLAVGETGPRPRNKNHLMAGGGEQLGQPVPDFFRRAAADGRHREEEAVDEGDFHAPRARSVVNY